MEIFAFRLASARQRVERSEFSQSGSNRFQADLIENWKSGNRNIVISRPLMSRIVLAMSGGVDSSVAAWLLKQEGHEIIGVFMRHGQEIVESCSVEEVSRAKQGCCSAADAADARRVAEMLDIPFYALNFEREFSRIVEYFVDEYLSGRTPNPCIVCNTWLKFGKLFEYADSVGAEFVATGHYARVLELGGGEIGLARGLDDLKDQSYVLFGIERNRLPRLKFPVGEHRKEEIRCIAEKLGLRVAQKPDSQEICFIPDQDHARFIRERRDDLKTAGDFVTVAGEVVGQHAGFEKFTVGQRKGLGLAFGEPRYVVRIEPETCRVVLGTREELRNDELTASGANWLLPEALLFPSNASVSCNIKIRYRSRAYAGEVTRLAANRFHVHFSEPVYGVAPGQAAVCYQGERVLGGGWIE
jgi:tRNA-uridine 2-sulfurtransferase